MKNSRRLPVPSGKIPRRHRRSRRFHLPARILHLRGQPGNKQHGKGQTHFEVVDEVEDRAIHVTGPGRGCEHFFPGAENGDVLAVENRKSLLSIAPLEIHPETIGTNERDLASLTELDLLTRFLQNVVSRANGDKFRSLDL